MTEKRVFGIDLGTSNCAVAAVAIGDSSNAIINVPLLQIHAPHQAADSTLLPSALYLPRPDEQNDFRMPWGATTDESTTPVIGRYARERSGEVPDQVITSVKSWLCHRGCDRHAAILPAGRDDATGRLSPVHSTELIINHLKSATDFWLTHEGHSARLSESDVVLTVPASFDDEARRLTIEAATVSGLPQVLLLEEPLAAFYSWVEDHKETWFRHITPGEMVLVCDVGGGTADFTLIAVSEKNGDLDLVRVAVGDHILLGGDNIDLAIAVHIRAVLQSQGTKVDRWQFGALTQLSRFAKETLLSDPLKNAVPLTIPTRGSNLFAAPLTFTLTREAVSRLVLDGFFPLVERSQALSGSPRTGLQEFGLPYASEPAFTKHLAAFLQKSDRIVRDTPEFSGLLVDGVVKPTAVLFNGGVFHSEFLRNRVLQLLQEWNGAVLVRELDSGHRDLAVARGATSFARNRASGQGLRIKAKTTRSYYIGVESTGPAVPGFAPPVKGLCVAPHGLEEGEERDLPHSRFVLHPGEQVNFRFFSSLDRVYDKVGTIVEDADFELAEMGRLETSITPHENSYEGGGIQVSLSARYSEVGVLEVAMKDINSSEQWTLEMNTRGKTE
jgi:Hsp70 protein